MRGVQRQAGKSWPLFRMVGHGRGLSQRWTEGRRLKVRASWGKEERGNDVDSEMKWGSVGEAMLCSYMQSFL